MQEKNPDCYEGLRKAVIKLSLSREKLNDFYGI